MKKYLLIFLFAFILFDVFSQVSISGIIQESGSGERLPYANILIKEIDLGTTTNENGYFTLNGNIKEGMVISASYVGYKTESIIIRSESINNEIEINLIPLSSTLNEVVIAANSN